MTLALSGIGVSPGTALGRAHVLQGNRLEILEVALIPGEADREVRRFMGALDTARTELVAIRERIPDAISDDIRGFIDTHLLMLDDPSITVAPMERIRRQLCNAEWALQQQRNALVRVFDEMDDPYLRTRKDDVDHVIKRIQRILLQQQADEAPNDNDGQHLKDRIILADDLAPADTLWMDHQGIAGFVTEFGGPMSHTAILARSLGIPAIVGVHGLSRYIREGAELVVDGQAGQVLADLDQPTRDYYVQRRSHEREHDATLQTLIDTPSISLDHCSIRLMANIELPGEISSVINLGADGVGLYRTEFLFMNRAHAPDEEEQFQTYVNVVRTLSDRPITIRTLDLGADKTTGSCSGGPVCANPALGLRAIRLCLQEVDTLFRPHLRAILRASAYGPVRIMLPMLSQVHEVLQARRIIEETQAELEERGEPFAREIAIGGMIETPAAAVAAGDFAQHLDFLSIGTNDLIQYVLAVDRMDDEVNYLYDPLHPAVLALIQQVIDAGKQAGIPVAMCGEMAGDPRYTHLLLAMGLEEFSMHPNALLEIKNIVASNDISALTTSYRQARASPEPGALRDWVDSTSHMPPLSS